MRVGMLSVNCTLEVRYCITGVNVYMDMNLVNIKKEKNLTDLSNLTAFFSPALLISHITNQKDNVCFF